MAAGRTNDLIAPSLATLPFRGVLATGKSEPDVPSVLSPQKAHNIPTQHSQRHTTAPSAMTPQAHADTCAAGIGGAGVTAY